MFSLFRKECVKKGQIHVMIQNMNNLSANHAKSPLSSGSVLLPWSSVIVLLVLVFPIGLFLMLVNLLSDKKKMIRNGFLLAIPGLLLTVSGFFLLLSDLLLQEESLRSLSFFFARSLFVLLPGIVLLTVGSILLLKGFRFRKLLCLIRDDGITAFSDLSMLLHLPERHVCLLLEELSEEGLLKDSHIDFENKRVLRISSGEQYLRLFPEWQRHTQPEEVCDEQTVSETPVGKTRPAFLPALEKWLWILSACTVLFGVILAPAGLLLAVTATFIEKHNPPRRIPLAAICGAGVAFFVVIMTETIGLMLFRENPYSAGNIILLKAYVPSLLISVYDYCAYRWLALRH